jgi:hypothetical protein
MAGKRNGDGLMKMSIDKETAEGDVVKSWNFRIFFTKQDVRLLHFVIGLFVLCLCWAVPFGITFLMFSEFGPIAGVFDALITAVFMILCGAFLANEFGRAFFE